MSDGERYLSGKSFCQCSHPDYGTFFSLSVCLVLPAEANKNELRSLSEKVGNKYTCFRTKKHPACKGWRLKREESDVKWQPEGPAWLANGFCLEQAVWLRVFFLMFKIYKHSDV